MRKSIIQERKARLEHCILESDDELWGTIGITPEDRNEYKSEFEREIKKAAKKANLRDYSFKIYAVERTIYNKRAKFVAAREVSFVRVKIIGINSKGNEDYRKLDFLYRKTDHISRPEMSVRG
jgi:hypothetical protein